MDLSNASDTGNSAWISEQSLSSSNFFLYNHSDAGAAAHGYSGGGNVLWQSNGSLPFPVTTAANNMTTMTTTTVVTDGVVSCAFEQPPLTDVRFWIVTVFGTGVSLVSIVENSFFFYLFSTRKHHRTTYNMYMMFLTFFDIFVSGAYVLLMSTNVLSDYLQSPLLVRIWFSYMVPILTVSHCGITSSCFLILAATFERYCLTLNSRWVHCVQRSRKCIILSAILLGIISKGTICIEFNVWRFWYRNIVTVFFPFFALLALNIGIVRELTLAERQSISSSNTNSKQFRRKKVARSATRTTVLVVFTYLISNIINVVLTTWEHIDNTLLITDLVHIYAIALDLASLLTNLASALRPPIYLICQPTLRQEVFAFIKRTCSCDATKPLLAYKTQTVTDIIYTKVDENSNCPAHTEHVNLSSMMPNCAALVSAAINAANVPDYMAMDLMKDEEEFLQDERDKSTDCDSEDSGADVVDLNSGGLESLAARMCRKRQLAAVNSHLVSMNCVNAARCRRQGTKMANGHAQNGSFVPWSRPSKTIIKNYKRIDDRSRSMDITCDSTSHRKSFALSARHHNDAEHKQRKLSSSSSQGGLTHANAICSTSLPTTPASFKTGSSSPRLSSVKSMPGYVVTVDRSPSLALSVDIANTTAIGALNGRLSNSLATLSPSSRHGSTDFGPLITAVAMHRRDSGATTIVLTKRNNNSNNCSDHANGIENEVLSYPANNDKLLKNDWLQQQFHDRETLL